LSTKALVNRLYTTIIARDASGHTKPDGLAVGSKNTLQLVTTELHCSIPRHRTPGFFSAVLGMSPTLKHSNCLRQTWQFLRAGFSLNLNLSRVLAEHALSHQNISRFSHYNGFNFLVQKVFQLQKEIRRFNPKANRSPADIRGIYAESCWNDMLCIYTFWALIDMTQKSTQQNPMLTITPDIEKHHPMMRYKHTLPYYHSSKSFRPTLIILGLASGYEHSSIGEVLYVGKTPLHNDK
jgi:hypothetical protein